MKLWACSGSVANRKRSASCARRRGVDRHASGMVRPLPRCRYPPPQGPATGRTEASRQGTIERVLQGLLGKDSYASPTLASLGTNFGPAVLIGTPLAIIGDAPLGTRTDQALVAERLLSISGEDAQTIDRKFLPAWTGRLDTRFFVITNELPRLTDASGALASRFIVLTLTRSFLRSRGPRHGRQARHRTARHSQLGARRLRSPAGPRLFRPARKRTRCYRRPRRCVRRR